MAIYERVYLSHLSGSWALRVLRGFHKLDCKELKFLLTTSPFIPRCPVMTIALSYKMICHVYFNGPLSGSLN